jgi:hypothetical protein
VLLLWPEKVATIFFEVELAFAAAELPPFCCQILAPRIFAHPIVICGCTWHEVEKRKPIGMFLMQQRIVEVYVPQFHAMHGRRFWFLFLEKSVYIFVFDVRRDIPHPNCQTRVWQLPNSGLLGFGTCQTWVWQLPGQSFGTKRLSKNLCWCCCIMFVLFQCICFAIALLS